MKTNPTPLEGACVVELNRHEDSRGYFTRVFCTELFKELGLPPVVAQINRSKSATKHTLRGLHYQLPPHQEAKTFICTKGAIFDVFLDVRPESKTFLQHHAVVLSADEPRLIHVPKGLANGILTLEENTEITYFVDQAYNLDSERGIRWNDPKFQIDWPAQPTVISDKDAALPDFSFEHHLPHANRP